MTVSLDVALRAPVAVKLPERTPEHLHLDWLFHMAACSASPQSRALWAGRLNDFRNRVFRADEQRK